MTGQSSPDSANLLPCPFCTSENVHCCFGLGATYVVECQSCETGGPRAMDKPTAISAWNTRTIAAHSSADSERRALADRLEHQPYANGIAFKYKEFRMVIDALRGVAQPSAGIGGPVAWQFCQRSGIGKGPQSQAPWGDWCGIEREDYERYTREPNPLIQVRPLYASPQPARSSAGSASLADQLERRPIDNESGGRSGPFVLIEPELRNQIVAALRAAC